MILGNPKDEENYICVDSKMAVKLHKVGFIPVARAFNEDKIYFVKTEEICDFLKYLLEDIYE